MFATKQKAITACASALTQASHGHRMPQKEQTDLHRLIRLEGNCSFPVTKRILTTITTQISSASPRHTFGFDAKIETSITVSIMGLTYDSLAGNQRLVW